jgi:pimeloyl-ACP methyl ester carboxylesterase
MAAPVEGYCTFRGMRTWYRVSGDLASDRVPLVLLHGGPGFPSGYLSPIEQLAPSRAVVRYDQIGSGRSDWPDDPTLWRIDTFVDELATLREQLGLERVHLLGHSWGGQLALEYLFTRPEGVESLVLASSMFSSRCFADECKRLREGLPLHLRRAMQRFEENYRIDPAYSRQSNGVTKAGVAPEEVEMQARLMRLVMPVLTTSPVQRLASLASLVPALRSLAYQVAEFAFVRQHVCRLAKPPLTLLQDFPRINRAVFETMWGPSDFLVSGNLASWDVESRLSDVDIPTLITSGRYDHSTPMQNRRLNEGIAGSRWQVFEGSAHFAHIEEPDRYLEVVSAFLAGVEADRHQGPAHVVSPSSSPS